MTVKAFIKKMLSHACVYFSCIMLCYIVIATIVNVSDQSLLLDAGRTVLFFVFSLLFALANGIFALENLSTSLRVISHYLITVFSFYACFLLTLSMRAASVIVGLVIFSILYFIVLGLVFSFRSRLRTNVQRAEKYDKQYNKLKK